MNRCNIEHEISPFLLLVTLLQPEAPLLIILIFPKEFIHFNGGFVRCGSVRAPIHSDSIQIFRPLGGVLAHNVKPLRFINNIPFSISLCCTSAINPEHSNNTALFNLLGISFCDQTSVFSCSSQQPATSALYHVVGLLKSAAYSQRLSRFPISLVVNHCSLYSRAGLAAFQVD